MQYRNLPHGNEKISIIGMGSSPLPVDQDIAVATYKTALDAGVNIFDLCGMQATNFNAFGKAIEGRREEVYMQLPVGADYMTGQYGWTINYDKAVKSFEWQMKTIGTDYCDFAMIHCIDTLEDLEKYQNNGTLKYLQNLQKEGTVRHIGLSTHNPKIANAVLDMGIIDLMMYSINPLYDYGIGNFAMGKPEDRAALYKRCQKDGVAITVMKAFNRGQLLDPKQTPFEHELTIPQCIEYALSKPAVVSVMGGAADPEQMKVNLSYLDCTEKERDYTVMGKLLQTDCKKRCCYCGHCHPCPKGLQVSLINKYYDLAKNGDEQAAEHYRNLDKKAGDCTQCGHCDSRCPFGVTQTERMREIKEYFGE